MGFNQLANGWEYYSISEELSIFSEQLYGFLANIAPGWFLLVFSVFMGFFIVYVVIYVKMYMKNMTSKTGGL